MHACVHARAPVSLSASLHVREVWRTVCLSIIRVAFGRIMHLTWNDAIVCEADTERLLVASSIIVYIV